MSGDLDISDINHHPPYPLQVISIKPIPSSLIVPLGLGYEGTAIGWSADRCHVTGASISTAITLRAVKRWSAEKDPHC